MSAELVSSPEEVSALHPKPEVFYEEMTLEVRKKEVTLLVNKILRTLFEKMDAPVSFVQEYEKKIIANMNDTLSSPKIPDTAKFKFLQDIEAKMEGVIKISQDDIKKLRDYRIGSLKLIFLSDLEEEQFMKKSPDGKLVKMNEADIDRHYLRMILDANLAKYID